MIRRTFFSNRQKHLARKAVYRAVKAGRLLKPETCTACPRRGNIHAHHDDYGRPLDVLWLCHRCHNVLHAAEAQDMRLIKQAYIKSFMEDAVAASRRVLGDG